MPPPIPVMVKVMQAYEKGDAIEVTHKDSKDWKETYYPAWDWYNYRYRVKPKTPLKDYRQVKFKNEKESLYS